MEVVSLLCLHFFGKIERCCFFVVEILVISSELKRSIFGLIAESSWNEIDMIWPFGRLSALMKVSTHARLLTIGF